MLVLFNVFINYLETGIECALSKFADDTKLGGAEDSHEDRKILQRDLDRPVKWAVTNLTKFNKNKCQILKLGQGNPDYAYKLGDKKLVSNPAARAWGVWVDVKLNIGQPCALDFGILFHMKLSFSK